MADQFLRKQFRGWNIKLSAQNL